MKYIDADSLIHDLEERIYAYSEGYANGDNYRKDAIETLLKDIRYQCSLQRERQEVDLEKEIEKEWEKLEKDYSPSALDKSYMIVSGLIGRKQFSLIAHHFHELCKNSK